MKYLIEALKVENFIVVLGLTKIISDNILPVFPLFHALVFWHDVIISCQDEMHETIKSIFGTIFVCVILK